jgi:hypothetical protein
MGERGVSHRVSVPARLLAVGGEAFGPNAQCDAGVIMPFAISDRAHHCIIRRRRRRRRRGDGHLVVMVVPSQQLVLPSAFREGRTAPLWTSSLLTGSRTGGKHLQLWELAWWGAGAVEAALCGDPRERRGSTCRTVAPHRGRAMQTHQSVPVWCLLHHVQFTFPVGFHPQRSRHCKWGGASSCSSLPTCDGPEAQVAQQALPAQGLAHWQVQPRLVGLPHLPRGEAVRAPQVGVVVADAPAPSAARRLGAAQRLHVQPP